MSEGQRGEDCIKSNKMSEGLENEMQTEEPVLASPSGTGGVAPKQRGLASILGKLDSLSETGLKKVLFNLPFVLFLVMLAALHIASNHVAENYARRITKTEKEVKLLRWQYMTTASGLMLRSKQSRVAQMVDTLGVRELRIPPFKIEVKKD
jgi:hypothetical protein